MLIIHKLFYSFFIILFPVLSYSQIRYGNEIIYKFTNNILENLEQDTLSNFWKAAEDFSFIGDFQNALIYGGKGRQPYPDISKSDSLFFKSFHPVDAYEYILKRARNEQIIMINEAHHFPFHRVFINTLLKGLYNLGFRYYGAEALDFRDSTINQRGYPVLSSGYYIAEPQFGNLIREALNLGYTLFPYEARSFKLFRDPKLRELEQAKNIQQILSKDSTAKILIHAGYAHIREDSLGGQWEKAMAGRFVELTGINPLTINQEVLTERIEPSIENPFYRMLEVETPAVLIDELENVFSGPEGTNYYDVRLYHPRTQYIEDRPHWLLYKNKKHVYLTDKHLFKEFPCIVQAYNFHEDVDYAIPTDVVEIVNAQTFKPLVLAPGDYQIVIKGQKGSLKKFSINVD